jgi:hypothetical protein
MIVHILIKVTDDMIHILTSDILTWQFDHGIHGTRMVHKGYQVYRTREDSHNLFLRIMMEVKLQIKKAVGKI